MVRPGIVPPNKTQTSSCCVRLTAYRYHNIMRTYFYYQVLLDVYTGDSPFQGVYSHTEDSIQAPGFFL